MENYWLLLLFFLISPYSNSFLGSVWVDTDQGCPLVSLHAVPWAGGTLAEMLIVASVAALEKQTCHRGEVRGWGRTGPSPENDGLGGTGTARVTKRGHCRTPGSLQKAGLDFSTPQIARETPPSSTPSFDPLEDEQNRWGRKGLESGGRTKLVIKAPSKVTQACHPADLGSRSARGGAAAPGFLRGPCRWRSFGTSSGREQLKTPQVRSCCGGFPRSLHGVQSRDGVKLRP